VKTRIGPPVRRQGQWELPPCPPHYTCWIGSYGGRAEAIEARVGLERTINSPSWRRMMIENDSSNKNVMHTTSKNVMHLSDEKDFEKQWTAAKKKRLLQLNRNNK